MSWTKPLGWLGRSVTSLGPLDALGAGMDYVQGKEEGEDDVRAIAGAAGSTAGGWGGAMAGAALGTAAIPIPVVGTAVGAIAGSMLGGFAGGWGADRADELIRGKKGNTNDLGDVAKGAAGVGLLAAGGAYGLNKGKKSMGFIPSQAWQMGRSLQRPAAIGGALVAGTVANNMMGNPIGGAIDATTGMLTGGRGTDLKPNEIQGPATISGRSAAVRDPYEDLVRVRGFANEREALEFQNYLGQQNQQLAYDRKFAYDDYMNQQKINSDQALQMINSYNQGMNNATNAANVILNAKWI